MVARLLVVVGALMGLFAMHGLEDHGASSHKINAPMRPPVMAVSHAGHAIDSAVGEAVEVSVSVADPGEKSSGMAMLGLCLAVLAGAVIGLLLLRPPGAVVYVCGAARAVGATWPSARRDRDPPCLFELSVLRT